MTWLNASDILKHSNFHAMIVWLQFHVQGQRWYQKEFFHETTFNLTTHKQTPEVCFDLQPGTNYSVNISMVALNFSLLVSLTTQITGRSCHLFSLFTKAPMGARGSSETALLISVLYGGLSKCSFHAQNCSLLFVFTDFIGLTVQQQKGERNGGAVFWSVILAQQGKDNLVG